MEEKQSKDAAAGPSRPGPSGGAVGLNEGAAR